MPHLAGRCDCGRPIHFPKHATYGATWTCYKCGKTWTMSTHGNPLHSQGSRAPQGSSGGSSCFVATAVFRSADCFEVIQLRDFRDSVLTKHPMGCKFIRWYYRNGPTLAECVNRHPLVQPVCRLLLTLFVRLIGQWTKPMQVNGIPIIPDADAECAADHARLSEEKGI